MFRKWSRTQEKINAEIKEEPHEDEDFGDEDGKQMRLYQCVVVNRDGQLCRFVYRCAEIVQRVSLLSARQPL